MRRALSFLFLATAAIGCYSKSSESAKVPLGQAPPAAAATGGGLTGPVLERLNASPYIYIRVKTPRGEIWAAVPEAKVDVGTEVTVVNAMLMANFESKTLKRTFGEVYFGTLASAGSAAAGGPAGNPHTGAPLAPAPIDVGKVEKASGPDARTVAEVWAQKASLAGKTVTIRGVVVKYNEGVMGKNWMHLQDGSGDAKQATHDITVTSLDGATKGETVTITGTVRANKDFGAGYVYALIVEDAKVLKKS
jgi:VCBS repeat-containing protein